MIFRDSRIRPFVFAYSCVMYATQHYPSHPKLALSFRQDARRFLARLRRRFS
jgi:hypothetical protein